MQGQEQEMPNYYFYNLMSPFAQIPFPFTTTSYWKLIFKKV